MIHQSQSVDYAVRLVRTAWHGREIYPAAACYELVLPLRGAYRVRCTRFATLLDPSRYVLGVPGEDVELSDPVPDGYESMIIGFDREALERLLEGRPHPMTGMVMPEVEIGIRRLRSALLVGDRIMVRQLASQVVAAALAEQGPAAHAYSGVGTAAQQAVDRRTFDDACAVLAVELELSAHDLAARVGCSPGHLSRVFVRRTGTGVGAYRAALRAVRALQALSDDRHRSLADLAADAGYADHAHLTRTVRSRYGQVPSRLRQMLSS